MKDLKEENPMMDIWTESKSATQGDLMRNTDLPEGKLDSRLKAMSALGNVGLSPDPPQLRLVTATRNLVSLTSSIEGYKQKEVSRELHAPFRELFLAEEEKLSFLSVTYERLKNCRLSTARSRQDTEPSLDEDTAAVMEIQKSLCSAVGAIEGG